MEEEIWEGGRVGYRGIEFGRPSPHDVCLCGPVPPQKRFHHSKVVGSNPAPATTSVITRSPSRSSHRGGVCVCIDPKGKLADGRHLVPVSGSITRPLAIAGSYSLPDPAIHYPPRPCGGAVAPPLRLLPS